MIIAEHFRTNIEYHHPKNHVSFSCVVLLNFIASTFQQIARSSSHRKHNFSGWFGLRRAGFLNLKIPNMDDDRMVTRIRQGKGGKDRYTLLSKGLLKDLGTYYMEYKPK